MIGINKDKTLKLEGIAKDLYDSRPKNIEFTLYKSNRGFSITFTDKKIKVSIVFGGANYCEHYIKPFVGENGSLPWTSKDFEVGVKHPENDQWYVVPGHDGDGIHPYANFEELDEILNYVMNTPKLKIIDIASKKRSMTYRQKKIPK
jgi:hypothetical protein